MALGDNEVGARLALKGQREFQQGAKDAAESIKGLGDAADKAERKSGNAFSKIGGGIASVGKKALGIVGTAAKVGTALGAAFGGVAIAKGVSRLTTIENATTALNVVLGDTAKTAAFMDEILDVVRGTPFNLDQFADAGKNLVAFGAQAEKVPGWLTAIGETAAASGGGGETVDRIVRAMGQSVARGKITGDTLMSLSEAGVPALQILANQYGKTTEEMQKMISKGAVPAEEGIDKLTQGIMKGTDGAAGATVAFEGSMEGLRGTFTGALGGMNAAVARFGAKLAGPFMGLMTQGFTGVADLLDTAGAKAGEFAEAFSTKIVGKIEEGKKAFQQFRVGMEHGLTLLPAQRLGVKFQELREDIDEFVNGARISLIRFKAGFTRGLDANPMQRFGSGVRDTLDRLGGVLQTIGPPVRDLVMAFGPLIETFARASAKIGISTWAVFLTLLELAAQIIATLLPATTSLVDWLARNEAVVTALLGAYIAWSLTMKAIAFTKLIVGLVQSSIALATHTKAWILAKWKVAGTIFFWVRVIAMYMWAVIKDLARASANVVMHVAKVVWGWVVMAAKGAWYVIRLGIHAAVVVAKWVWMAAQALWAAGRMALSWFIALGPVGWVIAAIIALVVLIIANWDTVKEWTIRIFSAIWGFIQRAWQWVKDSATSVKNWIVTKWNEMVAWFRAIPGRVAAVASRLWQSVKDKTNEVKTWITDKFNEVLDFFRGLPSRISTAVRGLFDGIKEAFRSAINWIIDKWNGLSFGMSEKTLPEWMGGGTIGGFSISTPNIPRLHKGGTVTEGGTVNIRPDEELVVLPPAASVVPLEGSSTVALSTLQGGSDRQPKVIQVVLDRRVLAEAVYDETRDKVARR